MLKLTMLTTIHSRRDETDNLYHDTYQTCWNWQLWPQDIPDMVKLTILTMTHSRHGKTGHFDHGTFKTCWNWQFWPQHNEHIKDIMKLDNFDHNEFKTCLNWQFWTRDIPDKVKLTILTMKTYQTCWNWPFWPWHIQDMLKLTIWTTRHSRHGETAWRHDGSPRASATLWLSGCLHGPWAGRKTQDPSGRGGVMYHDTYQTWWNWQFWPRLMQALLKLTSE
jgi:hypothetical protein